jgi:hypothetical protein
MNFNNKCFCAESKSKNKNNNELYKKSAILISSFLDHLISDKVFEKDDDKKYFVMPEYGGMLGFILYQQLGYIDVSQTNGKPWKIEPKFSVVGELCRINRTAFFVPDKLDNKKLADKIEIFIHVSDNQLEICRKKIREDEKALSIENENYNNPFNIVATVLFTNSKTNSDIRKSLIFRISERQDGKLGIVPLSILVDGVPITKVLGLNPAHEELATNAFDENMKNKILNHMKSLSDKK